MLKFNNIKRPDTPDQKFLSIIIPTFNESMNIINLINHIQRHVPKSISIEIIIVDDNSPDGTGTLVEHYINKKRESTNPEWNNHSDELDKMISNSSIKIIHREKKTGLISAILHGISSCSGQNILIMDADFSHPPELIENMIKELERDTDCIIIGSRYINGGSIIGMPFKRFMLSLGATFIARYGLSLRNVHDPMSGFFAFPRHILEGVKFNTSGYKILLEILIKKGNSTRIKEIPYTFKDRKYGQSKLSFSVILDYIKAIWKLYIHGRKSRKHILKAEQRNSALFISQAARFYSVGASGFLVNYLLSLFLSNGTLSSMSYLQSTSIGIALSVTTNFLLNKFWTFEDKNTSRRHFIKQYGSFLGFSSIGILIQLLFVYIFTESDMKYDVSLLLAVLVASASNFLLNKKVTFKEKIWNKNNI